MKMHGICGLALGCAAVMGTMAGAQTQTQGSDQDKQFLMQASQGDFTEITFSQLAAQQGSSPQVKAYAQKMISDHTMLEKDMKPFADQMGVTPATTLDAAHQQKYDTLKGLQGADFDKQYMSDMDADHHLTLQAFKTEESTTTDSSLKPVVKKGEKVVAQHTQMADRLVKKLGGTASGM